MSDKTRKIAVMFPGQGSQYLGMGAEFLAASEEARQVMAMAEEVSGIDLGRLIKEGPMEELTRTMNLQPAITAINLICWEALSRAGVEVDYVIGHSLGEYSALYASGILSMGDTLSLVTERGRLMEREGGKHPGGMRAVLGFSLADVKTALESLKPEDGVVVAANHNTPQQVVIAGELSGLDAASAFMEEKGAKVIALNVSIANHSPLLAGVISDFTAVMEKLDFKPPATPLLFNVSASEEIDPVVIRSNMASHMTSMVRWVDTLQKLAADGVDTFIEAGPKTVLSGLIKKTLGRSGFTYLQVDSPEKLAVCVENLDSL